MMSRSLYVGSNNSSVEALRLALSSSPQFGLDVVPSPEAALHMLSCGDYELAFAEEQLISSEFVRALRLSEAAVPVIALASANEPAVCDQSLAQGAFDCLLPAEIDASHVARAVRYARSQRESWLAQCASDERHRLLMNNSAHGLVRYEFIPPVDTSWTCDEQVSVLLDRAYVAECNDIKAQTYGFERASEFQGLWIRDLVREERDKIAKFLTVLVKSNYQLRNAEYVGVDHNGDTKHFLNNITGIIENGFLVGAWASQNDITSIRSNEVVQDQLKSIIASAHDQIFKVSLDGIIESWNQGAEEILGYSAEEIVGQHLRMVVPPEGVEQAKSVLARVKNGERVPNYDALRRHKDGTLRQVSMSVSPYFDAQKNVIGMWGVGRDITQGKRREEEVRRSEKLYHTLASNFPNGSVYLLDLEGRFLLAEGQGLSSVDLAPERIIGKTISEVFGEAELGTHLQQFYTKALQGIETTEEVEIRGHHRLVHVVPVRDEQGNVTTILAMTQDITEQKQAHAALERSEKLYHTLASNFPNGAVLLLDRDLRFVLAEGRGLDYWGMTSEQMIGKTFSELFGAYSGTQDLVELYQRALDGEAGNAEVTINGQHRWVHVVPIREDGEGSEISGVMAMTQDITALKRAQSELLTSQERLEVAVQSGRIALWEWNALTGEHRSTPYYKEQLGYGVEGFDETHEAFYDRLHPDDRTRVQEYNGRLFQENVPTFQDEFRLRHRDGEYRWILSQGTVFRDDKGNIERLLGSHIDITELKRGEEELLRSREALQRAHDELELRVQERTNELAQTNDALNIESIERREALDALQEAVGLLEQARDESERANAELRANEARLLYGNLVFAELTKLRVAKQSELEAAMRSIAQAATSVLDLERCGVWMYDEEENRVRCLDIYDRRKDKHGMAENVAVHDYPEHFRALRNGEIIMADDALNDPLTRELAQVYLAPEGIASLISVPILINGRMIGVLSCECIGEPRHWKVEDQVAIRSLAGICSLAMESLERARAEEDLRHAKNEAEAAREEAERANKAKSEFLSRMSHELRTPMNSILGFAQILEMTIKDEKQLQRVALILKAGRHLLNLINEVLDVARVESGHISLSTEQVLVENVVTMASEMVRPLYNQYDLQFEVDMSRCVDTYVLADQQRFSQVLLNLLSNAGKYNRKGGKVTVLGETGENNMLRISVSDTGQGIANKFLSRVFQPFERLGREGGAVEGTGLGLALSKHLIEAMGGKLGLTSQEGIGSTFWLELPVTENPFRRSGERAALEAGNAPNIAAPPMPPPTEVEHTILYIEDNTVNLKVLEHLLRNEPNVTLISAMQGQLGLDLARQHHPSLILLDLHLPDIDGDEVLRRLLTDPTLHDIPVVMLSADATPSQIAYLLAVGASEYLTKPLDLKLLMSVIRKFLS